MGIRLPRPCQDRQVFGETSQTCCPDYAWHASNSQGNMRAVGELMPNRFGLFDTLGNVSGMVPQPIHE